MSECKHEWEPAWIEYEDDVCRICECSKKYWKVQTRIAKLKAENAEHQQRRAAMELCIQARDATVAKLREALDDYAEHQSGCGGPLDDGPCSCGLDEALQQSGDTAGGG